MPKTKVPNKKVAKKIKKNKKINDKKNVKKDGILILMSKCIVKYKKKSNQNCSKKKKANKKSRI